MRRSTWIVFSILLLCLGLGFTWLTQTEKGLKVAVIIAEKLTPGQLVIHNPSGKLFGDFHVEHASYDNVHVGLTFTDVNINWRPWNLITSHIDLRTVNIAKTTILIKNNPHPSPEPFIAEDLSIPFILSIQDGHVKDISYKQGRALIQAEVLKLNTSWSHKGFKIPTLLLKNSWGQANIHGTISARSRTKNDLHAELERENWQGTIAAVGIWQDLNLTALLKQQLNSNQYGELNFDAKLKNLLTLLQWEFSLKGTMPAIPTLPIMQIDMLSNGALNNWNATARLASANNTSVINSKLLGRRDHVTSLNIDLQQDTKGSLTGSGEIFDFTDKPKAKLNLSWKALQWPVNGNIVAIPTGELSFNGDEKDFTAHLNSEFDLNTNFHLVNKLDLKGDLHKIILNNSEVRINNKPITVSGQINPDSSIWQLAWNSNKLQIPKTDYWHSIETALHGSAEGNFNTADFSVTIPKTNGTWGNIPFSAALNAKRTAGILSIAQQFKLAANEVGINATVMSDAKKTITADLELKLPKLEQISPILSGDINSKINLHGDPSLPDLIASISSKALQAPHVKSEQLNAQLRIANDQKSEWNNKIQAKLFSWDNYTIEDVALSLTGSRGKHNINATVTYLSNKLDLSAQGGFAGGNFAGGSLNNNVLANNIWNGSVNTLKITTPERNSWMLDKSTTLSFAANQTKMPAPLCIRHNAHNFCAQWNRQDLNHEINVHGKELPIDLLTIIPSLNAGKWNGTFDFKANTKINAAGPVAHAELDIHAGTFKPGTIKSNNKRWAETLTYAGGNVNLDINKKLQLNAELEAWPGATAKVTAELPNFATALHSDFLKQNLRGEINVTAKDLKPLNVTSPSFSNLDGRIQGKITVAGQLGDPKFTGNLQLMQGHADIPAAGITLNDVGMSIYANSDSNLNFEAKASSGEGVINAKGQAQFKNDQFKTEIKINGSNFKAVDIPEAQVYASPDLVLSYQNQKLNLNGTVTINKAKIEPREMRDFQGQSKDIKIVGAETTSEPSLQISSDIKLLLGDKVQFTGFNLNGNITGQIRLRSQPGRKTLANGELNVEKGQYNIYGQTLKIQRGRLLFAGGQLDNPGLDVRAERDVKVIMTASSQFQLLDQNNTGSEEKDIRDGVVGISLRGTLMQPDVHFYSNPALNEADQLSYLVVGVPSNNVSGAQSTLLTGAVSELADKMGLTERNRLFHQLEGIGHLDQVALESRSRYDAEKGMASSQTSLVLGKALSPKLFVSYSIGLLDPVSILQVRYKISRRWSLQTDTSDLGEGGGDLIYTIDKD